MGGQLGNAAISEIGYGKEMSEANFNAMATNQRAFYAQSGIKSKADGYQLANKAFEEGRFNEMDLLAAHQSLNMIFDQDGYQTAQKLMQGRHRGVEVAKEQSSKPPSESPQIKEPGSTVNEAIGDAVQKVDGAVKGGGAPKVSKDFRTRKIENARRMTKDEVRKLNEARYKGVSPMGEIPNNLTVNEGDIQSAYG